MFIILDQFCDGMIQLQYKWTEMKVPYMYKLQWAGCFKTEFLLNNFNFQFT